MLYSVHESGMCNIEDITINGHDHIRKDKHVTKRKQGLCYFSYISLNRR